MKIIENCKEETKAINFTKSFQDDDEDWNERELSDEDASNASIPIIRKMPSDTHTAITEEIG